MYDEHDRMGRGGEFEEADVCPECGITLEDVDIAVHIRHHWDKEPHPYQDKEGYKRFHFLLELTNKQEKGES